MRTSGGSLQSVFNQDLFKHENNLTVGASYDYATVHFGSNTELASLAPDRGTIAVAFMSMNPKCD